MPPTYTIRNFHFILTQFPKLFKKQIEDKVHFGQLSSIFFLLEYKVKTLRNTITKALLRVLTM